VASITNDKKTLALAESALQNGMVFDKRIVLMSKPEGERNPCRNSWSISVGSPSAPCAF